MKKGLIIISIILVLVIIFSFTLRAFIKHDYQESQETKTDSNFDSSYIEEIPDGAKRFIENLDNKVLKTRDEIEALNAEIFKKSQAMYNLSNIKKMSKEEIKNYITSYTLPDIPKYNDDLIVTSEEKKAISSNRNLDAVEDISNPKHGVIVNRANLKSFPTNIHFYDYEGIKNFDRIQETELLVNTEVVILSESKDKEWNFVLTESYFGWVEKNKIALFKDNNDRNTFIEPDNFLVITTSSLNINNKILDMSTKVPYIGPTKDGYEAILPIKGEDGFVKKEKVVIARNKAHIGYLDFTDRNVIIEAFKYEGVPYSWAGLDQNIDCSSFVSNVYRTFGIKLPRNTKAQSKSIGNIITLKNKSDEEKLSIIKEFSPSLLYQEGHVMLYIGNLDNKDYIIHASGEMKNLKVVVNELSNTPYLSKIFQLNSLK